MAAEGSGVGARERITEYEAENDGKPLSLLAGDGLFFPVALRNSEYAGKPAKSAEAGRKDFSERNVQQIRR
jgi:hypothetical protein